jgi:protein O-GlcNAc transferase
VSLAQAISLHRAGRRREAQTLYERALRDRPDDPATLFAYGLCLLEQGALPAGIGAMRRLARVDPRHAGAQQALGKALAMSGDAGGGEQHLRRAVDLAPQSPDAWIELGAVLAQSAPAKAESVLRDAVAHHPGNAALWCNLGNVLALRGRRDEAAASWRRALAIRPDLVEAELALALELRMAGQGDEAVAMLERAIARRPDMAELHYNLGVTYFHARKHGLAIAALERALAINPRLRRAVVQLAQAAQAICDWDKVDRALPALRAEADAALAGKPCLVTPFFALSLPLGGRERAAIGAVKAQEYVRQFAADGAGGFHRPGQAGDGRLRVGFLGSEFRNHPMAHIIAGLFPAFDRRAFRVTVYSHGPDDGSDYRRRIEQGAEQFVELRGLHHLDAARRIAADETEILVDLSAFTAMARPEIAVLRPAPVQATTMGLPSPTNAPFYDYVIADRIVVPPEHAGLHGEALVYLPDTYYFTDDAQPIAGETVARADEGLPATGFVFACYCAHFKIERTVFAAWMRLLQAVAGSVLWLYREAPESEANLRHAAAAAGVDPARLVFGQRRSKPAHLARLALADLCLDTLTYGGHTTSVDALWAGVPVVTRLGDAFASRVGASVLTAIDLPELIAPDLAGYEALALRLAQNPAELAALRTRLATNRRTAPLFDTSRFARGMEEAFRRMAQQHRAGAKPAPIDLTGWRQPASALGVSTS